MVGIAEGERNRLWYGYHNMTPANNNSHYITSIRTHIYRFKQNDVDVLTEEEKW